MAIDDEPCAIAVIGDEPDPAAMFLHHGNWPRRTKRDLDQKYWACVHSSGVGNYFPSCDLRADQSGPLEDLRGTSHEGAFLHSVTALARKSNGRK